MKTIKITLQIIFLSIVFFCSSCTKVVLTAQNTDPAVIQLANSNQKPLYLEISSPKDSRLGHQYLFFILPFGRIQHKNLTQAVKNKIYGKLALQGYHPVKYIAKKNIKVSSPVLKIKIYDISLSAYDLFFTRRLSATIKANYCINKTCYTIGANYSEFKSFGFQQQLDYVLNKTLNKLIDKINL